MSRIVSTAKALWKPLLGLLGLMVLIVWTAGSMKEKVPPAVLEYAPGFALPAEAETLVVRLQSLPQQVEAVGSVVSESAVQLSARISAYVQEVLVRAGEAVERDQVLIRLDDRELRAQVEAARAGLRQAQTEYERAKRLHETQAATEQQLIAAESTFHTARAQLEQAEAGLTDTEIRAPFDGRVTDQHAEVGTLAHPGHVLLNVFNPASMRLDVPVPVRLVDYLHIGESIEVQLERPAARWSGRVHRVVSEIDTRTRTQTVQVLLDSMDEPPIPGTFGRLWIPTSERDVAMVPRSAVYRVGQLELVQVVQADRVIRRLVKSGGERADDIEILSGLSDGETLLIHPIK